MRSAIQTDLQQVLNFIDKSNLSPLKLFNIFKKYGDDGFADEYINHSWKKIVKSREIRTTDCHSVVAIGYSNQL